MTRHAVVVFGLLAMLGASTCYSQQCTGNASTIVYGWKSQGDDTDTVHVIGSQQLRFDCSDILTDGLSFHTFVRALKDFSPGDSSVFQRILKIHNLYAQYDLPKWGNIRFGRQFLSFGVAKGSMDGATVTFRVPRIARLVGFAGMGVCGESLSVQSWDESQVVGGHLYSNYLPKTSVSVSLVQRASEDTTTEQKMGFDLRFRPYPGFTPFLGANYDFINSTINELYVGLFNTSHRILSTYLNYTYLKPTFAKDSYFKNFSEHTKSHSRMRLSTTYNPDWIAAFTASYVTSIYEKDVSYSFELTADGNYASIGAGHSFGFGGEHSNIFGTFNYPILAYLDMNVGVDYGTYGTATEEDVSETENDLVAYLGGDWRPFENVRIDMRVENLINEEYQYDIRFLSSLSVGFGF